MNLVRVTALIAQIVVYTYTRIKYGGPRAFRYFLPRKGNLDISIKRGGRGGRGGRKPPISTRAPHDDAHDDAHPHPPLTDSAPHTSHLLATVGVYGNLTRGKRKTKSSRWVLTPVIRKEPKKNTGTPGDDPGDGPLSFTLKLVIMTLRRTGDNRMKEEFQIQIDTSAQTDPPPLLPLRKVKLDSGVEMWHADLPIEENERYYEYEIGRETGEIRDYCLHFKILDEVSINRGDYEVCHNPGALPYMKNGGRKRKISYNMTMCYNQIMHTDDVHDGRLSGYRHLLPSIAYHSKHGWDQFVVYAPYWDYEGLQELLSGPIKDGLVTIIKLDESIAYLDPNLVAGNRANYVLLNRWRKVKFETLVWLANDCLNRYSGYSTFYRSMDVDELVYHPRWKTNTDDHKNILATKGGGPLRMPEESARQGTTKKDLYELNGLNGLSLYDELGDFEKDPFSSYIRGWPVHFRLPKWEPLYHATERATRLKKGKFGKTILKPDEVYFDWTHYPGLCRQSHGCRRYEAMSFNYGHIKLGEKKKKRRKR